MTQHTPTPWKYGPGLIIWNGDGFLVAQVAGQPGMPEAEADAAFIVRACNSHEALVRLAEMVEDRFKDSDTARLVHTNDTLLAAASAALALAKEA